MAGMQVGKIALAAEGDGFALAGVLELPPDQLVVPDQRAFDGMDV